MPPGSKNVQHQLKHDDIQHPSLAAVAVQWMVKLGQTMAEDIIEAGGLGQTLDPMTSVTRVWPNLALPRTAASTWLSCLPSAPLVGAVLDKLRTALATAVESPQEMRQHAQLCSKHFEILWQLPLYPASWCQLNNAPLCITPPQHSCHRQADIRAGYAAAILTRSNV